MYITPPRFLPGDEIRIIAPSQSMAIVSSDCQQRATHRLEQIGLTVSFGKNCASINDFNSSSIQERIADLHDAFEDKKIKGVLTVLGGYNSNQLLDNIDYSLIQANPKIFCGYSDITALQNAFLSKTGLVTYSGPHYSTFGCKLAVDWIITQFQKATFHNQLSEITPSHQWSDDLWYLNQDNRKFINNEGIWVISEGDAEGTIVGGNLSTLCLLCGTEYFPNMDKTILFLEDDFESHVNLFDRQLQQLTMQPNFDKVRALVIGRFQNASKITRTLLEQLIKSKDILKNIPIIANVDFGHTMPFFTYPIGGAARVSANKKGAHLFI
ncbi:LD-carboxypeptidase [Legionella sp. km535]|uniref:S66 family peptidase n=1 Tax=Legionella sp. km535 TaxID=2498107 RepID=UPI000F8E887A|nr:S66 peptidase family protein [Legionella sp. km535]RUR20198.1 LD-carboxypeptidase [Legionella sp. km535]